MWVANDFSPPALAFFLLVVLYFGKTQTRHVWLFLSSQEKVDVDHKLQTQTHLEKEDEKN